MAGGFTSVGWWLGLSAPVKQGGFRTPLPGWYFAGAPVEERPVESRAVSGGHGGSSSWDRYTREQQRRYDELVAELLETELKLEKAEAKVKVRTTGRLKLVEEPGQLKELRALVKALRAKLKKLKKELKKLYKELIQAEEEEHLIITLMLI